MRAVSADQNVAFLSDHPKPTSMGQCVFGTAADDGRDDIALEAAVSRLSLEASALKVPTATI